MSDAFTALSACIATLEPLDHGDRARVLHALTSALDLTEPVVVRNVVVAQSTADVAVVGVARKPKKTPEPKPVPKAPADNTGKRIDEDEILDAIRQLGPSKPHDVGKLIGRTAGACNAVMGRMFTARILGKTGIGRAVRYSIRAAR